MQSQLEFFRIDEDLCKRVRRLKPRLMKYAEAALDYVFRHLEDNPDVSHYFSINENVGYLRDGMLAHCDLLFSARFDETYFTAVDQIGLRHSKLDFPSHIYSAAYSNMLAGMQWQAMKRWPRFSPEDMMSLTRIALLDMELTESSFFRHQMEKQAALDADAAKMRDLLNTSSSAA